MCVPGTAEIVRARLEADPPAPVESLRLSRRAALLAGAGTALAAATAPSPALAWRGGRRRRGLADLTHTFRDDFPLYPALPGAGIERTTLATVPVEGFYAQRWSFIEHSCTHMDAPAHFAAGGRTTPELTLRELIAPVVVVDISERARREPDTIVEPDDLLRFERRHGRIPRGAVVCMDSGWAERASSAEAYLNRDAAGTMRFPGFGVPAVRWLLEERDIHGIGVDTLSLDHGSSATFEVHYTLLPADRYGIENLRGLGALPPRGATINVGVIPWQDGSGGPCRVFATW